MAKKKNHHISVEEKAEFKTQWDEVRNYILKNAPEKILKEPIHCVDRKVEKDYE